MAISPEMWKRYFEQVEEDKVLREKAKSIPDKIRPTCACGKKMCLTVFVDKDGYEFTYWRCLDCEAPDKEIYGYHW